MGIRVESRDLSPRLAADDAYRDRMKSYTLGDTAAALMFYVLILAVYYVMGWLMAHTGAYYGVAVNVAIMLIPILLCRKLSAVGLTNRNLMRSLAVSFGLGMAFLLASTIVPGILSHAQLLPAGVIVKNLMYYFVIIALSEEISFRGFIQPRLYPLFRNEALVILFGGVLFVLMHYPYQMAARGMTFAQYFPQFIANAPFQFLWHLVFTFLYRRYGNLFGSTVLHGCVDMSMGLFG